jgi:hypothetical protein
MVFSGPCFLGSSWYYVHGFPVINPIKGLVKSIVNGPRGK